MADLAINLDRDIEAWISSGDDNLTFVATDANALPVADKPSPEFEKALLRLSAEVGLLMTDYTAGRLKQNRSALKGRLIAVLKARRTAGHEAGVPLSKAAQSNLAKINDRWPQTRIPSPLFDSDFPLSEQLPRRLEIKIEETGQDGKTVAKLTRNGVPGRRSANRQSGRR